MPATCLHERCDPLCCHVAGNETQHRLKWLLTETEREAILQCSSNTISDFWKVEPKGKTSAEKIEASKQRCEQLFLKAPEDKAAGPGDERVLKELYEHIRAKLLESSSTGEDYFLRLSSLSPKDAYLFLELDESDSSDSEVDIAELQHDLHLLKTSLKDFDGDATAAATHAMHVLLHSERVKLDCQSEEKSLYVLLLPWQPTTISGELRLFVKGSLCKTHDGAADGPKLLAFSQYFEDLHGCYGDSDDSDESGVADLYARVQAYFNEEFDKTTLPINAETGCLEDVSLDIDVDMTAAASGAKPVVRLIEFNLLRHADTCFFEREEVNELLEKPDISKPSFRYRRKGADDFTEYHE